MFRLLQRFLIVIWVVAFAGTAHATTVNITTDGDWFQLDVDEVIAASAGLEWIDAITGPDGYNGDGSVLTFSFTLSTPGVLAVVDAGFAGDEFQLFNGGTPFGFTSDVAQTDISSASNSGSDFDTAFADHTNFSFTEIVLGPGTYNISGMLSQSVLDGSNPLNATLGALRVSAVPLPPAIWLMSLALAGTFGFARRRSH